MIRIGQGFDSHRFAAGRPLVLGGVVISHEFGLDGHSDADALTHAVIDALLGALALGDIGQRFPDTDPKYRDADSLALLRQVLTLAAFRAWQVENLDATVIAEKPRLAPHIVAMRERLSQTLGVSIDRVSIKAKTAEGMGFCGDGEGLAAFVNLSLTPRS